MRGLVVSLAFAATALLAVPAAAALKITKVKIVEHRKSYDIDIAYPQTGNAAVDKILAKFARDEARSMTQYADGSGDKPDDDSSGKSDLTLDYAVARNDAKMLVVTFSGSEYGAGAAHPNPVFATFNFMIPSGTQVELADLVDGQRALNRISALAMPLLRKQLAANDGSIDSGWMNTGAGPQASNFQIFEWLPAGLRIIFPPYQVASYADGTHVITIPLAELKGYVRPDWRAPAPSFDCVKASAPIEHIICSNARLAWYDRHVAEAYRAKLTTFDKPNEAEAFRQTQRDWLAARVGQCKFDEACLISNYQARLKQLDRTN